MKQRNTKDPTICDGNNMKCTACGDTFPMPFGKIEFCMRTIRAFVNAHRYCDGGKGKTFKKETRQ